jgi:hypothetical protein
MTARQAQIDELNLKHGLGPGHNRAKSGTTAESAARMQFLKKVSGLDATAD